ncbi:MAG: alpha/beta hydrolase [Lentisphaeria bacterium]|nr:alpha/beta hydrolase [Lentisphaeria bacterium]
MNHQFQSYYLDKPLVQGRVFDIFEPEKITKDISVFFIHGGGWQAGSRVFSHVFMQELNERGYLCASTDYRLGGVTAFEQIQDIRESYDRFVSFLKAKGRPLKISVHGGSAGAHLASMLAYADPGECGEKCTLENEWVKPTLATLHATPYSFLHWEGMMPQFWAQMQRVAGKPYAEDPDRYERLSLKNYVRQDNPPTFFIEAELEHLFPSEDTLKIAKKQREMGIPSQWKVYHRVEHGFFYDLKRKMQIEAFEDFCKFLEGKLETF